MSKHPFHDRRRRGPGVRSGRSRRRGPVPRRGRRAHLHAPAAGSGFIIGSSTRNCAAVQPPGPRRILSRHHLQVRHRHRLHQAGVDRLGRARADSQPSAASLNGNYAGVGAEATVGLGVGANALLGGSSVDHAAAAERAGARRPEHCRRRRVAEACAPNVSARLHPQHAYPARDVEQAHGGRGYIGERRGLAGSSRAAGMSSS